MVRVEIFEDDAGRIAAFQVEGHAGFGESGEDLVCAAVSVLTQTAVLGLEHHLDASPEVEVEKGRLRCQLPVLTIRDMEQAEVILRTMYLGLMAIAENYDQYIQVKMRRWTGC